MIERQLNAFSKEDETLVYSITFDEDLIPRLRHLFDTGNDDYDPDMIFSYHVRPEIRATIGRILNHKLSEDLEYYIDSAER